MYSGETHLFALRAPSAVIITNITCKKLAPCFFSFSLKKKKKSQGIR